MKIVFCLPDPSTLHDASLVLDTDSAQFAIAPAVQQVPPAVFARARLPWTFGAYVESGSLKVMKGKVESVGDAIDEVEPSRRNPIVLKYGFCGRLMLGA